MIHSRTREVVDAFPDYNSIILPKNQGGTIGDGSNVPDTVTPKRRGLIFAVDFDGTIVENRYPDIGPLILEAREAMRLMKDHGHTVIVWTCREGARLAEMIAFLDANNVPYDHVNDHAPWMKSVFKNNPRKIYADYYIDDHNISGWTWQQVVELVLKLSTFNGVMIGGGIND